MDRQITYPGQLLTESSLLTATKDAMIGCAKLSSAVLGTSTIANGFAVTPTGPASLQVLCAPGEIYSMTAIDAAVFSSLPADTTHSILKQGILLDGATLNCPAPGTTGQSINYLVQVTYQDSDLVPVLLPYYNSANPSLPFSGMGNNGLPQNTIRKGVAVVAVKAGASATTGSQVTPAPDAGYIGLYVVTVAFGQTTITSGSISLAANAPIINSTLHGLSPVFSVPLTVGAATTSQQAVTAAQLQTGFGKFATDIGTANTIIANFAPAITSPVADGSVITVLIAASNTGATTLNASSTGATSVLGLGSGSLQGGELTAGNRATFMFASSSGWTLLYSQASALQVGPASKSGHALQLGQATGRLLASRLVTSTATYTPTTGALTAYVQQVGAGGAGGGVVSTATGSTGAGCGGSAGGMAEGLYAVSTLSGLVMTIGTGGTGVAGGAGGAGTSTTFGGLISAAGGSGGAPGQNLVPPWILGETGNSPLSTGGNLKNTRGISGGGSQSVSTGSIISGRGGSSPFGAGGNSVGTIRAAGNAGTGPGAGGSGALEQSAGAGGLAGGNGSAGAILIMEYS